MFVQFLFDVIDFGCDVGFVDFQYFGNFCVVVVFQVQQNQCVIECIEFVDEGVQCGQVFVFFCDIGIGQCVQVMCIQWFNVFGQQGVVVLVVGDCYVECDVIYLG